MGVRSWLFVTNVNVKWSHTILYLFWISYK